MPEPWQQRYHCPSTSPHQAGIHTHRKNTVEVIAIGNELLIGHTLDTNSNWIARQVTKHGWTLQRVTQLRDSLDTIKNGVKEALARSPSLLLTIGGLGPTYDDMTLRGIGRALKRDLVLNRKALEMILDHYHNMERPTPMTSHRRKMAMLPRGAEPLLNPVGTAPGILASSGRTAVVSLPGVPQEMKAIFTGSVIPLLKTSNAKPPEEVYLQLTGIIESALAPVLARAQRKYPGLYFKSHPRGRETGVRSLIRLHIYTTDPKSKARLHQALAYIVKNVAGKRVAKKLASAHNSPRYTRRKTSPTSITSKPSG